MKLSREIIEAIISQLDDEMQMAAQIRATEAGYPSVVDYFLSLHEKLGDDPDFQEFRERRESSMTLEEQQAEWLRAYFEEE